MLFCFFWFLVLCRVSRWSIQQNFRHMFLYLEVLSLFYRFSSFHLPFFSSPLFPFFLSFFSSFSFFIFKGLFIFYKRSFKIFVLVNNPCTPKQLAKLQRQLAHKKKFSNNWYKQKHKIVLIWKFLKKKEIVY